MLWNKQEITSFERDKLHRETGRKLANQLQAQTQYDPMGRMLQQTLSGKTNSNSSYQYDPVGKLLAANTPKHQETFAFDPASNLLDSAGKAENTLPNQTPRILDNLLKQYAGTHFKYDARGNLTEKQRGEQITKLSWDGFNRLSEVQTTEGATQYYYDAFGRRIGKENAQGQAAFIWDGDVIALEKTAEHTRHYLFEPNSFVPLAQIVTANDSEQEHTAYYHVDHLGTPQTLSDENGEIAWSAEYKAWGEAQVVISEAAKTAGINNPLRFQGQYADEESGLHYNRYRYYDPEIGRFISSDPIGLLGGFNTHAYAPNPVGWIDPLGLANLGQIGTSGNLNGGEHIGDNLQAHELLRHEYLVQKGMASKDCRDSENPSIAFDLDRHTRSPAKDSRGIGGAHYHEGKIRQQQGLGRNEFHDNLKHELDITQGALRKAGIPASQARKLRKKTNEYVSNKSKSCVCPCNN